jgi:CheY-like chemotaxis protein
MKDMTMRKTRILVVDDEAGVTRLLKLNLEQTGNYKVREVNIGSKVSDVARESKPDLILLDVMLPDTDGGQIAAELKADPQFAKTPIVFLTAAVDKEEVKANKGVIGGYPFIAKPLHVKSVIRVIEANLAD